MPVLEIISKTIPVGRRGKFFGTRRLIGGIAGILVGIVVALILGAQADLPLMGTRLFLWIEAALDRLGLMGQPFPLDYGFVFLLGWMAVSVGMIVFMFVAEPAAVKVQQSARLVEQVQSGWRLLRTDHDYRRFYMVRICFQFTVMAFPFYIAYAYHELQFSEGLVGLFLSIWIGAGVSSNYFWGRLLDNNGNRIVLVITAVLSIFPPLIMLVARFSGAGGDAGAMQAFLPLLILTFVLNGAVRSGRIIANITYLLEFAPETRRPLYVGFLNTFSFPFMLSPLLGGLIVQGFGYHALFAISLVAATLNVILSARLHEPRSAKPTEKWS